MIRLLLVLAALLWPAVASAQSPVSVIGPVTPGDCALFNSNTVIKDAGYSCVGGGQVVGPVSSVVGDITLFNNTTGNLLSDSGVPIFGIAANLLNTQTTNYTIQTSDCGKTIQAGTGSTGFFTITIPSISGFAANCVVRVVNGDTGRAKRIANDPGCAPVFRFLWPGQVCTFGIVNGAWTSFDTPGRWELITGVTFYADSTNGHDDGSTDCLAPGASACQTITNAAILVCDDVALNGQLVSITPPIGVNQVENVSLCNYVPGHGAAGSVNPQIFGSTSTPSNYSIQPTSGSAVTAVDIATPWTLKGISLGGGSTGTCIESDINSLIYVSNTVFNSCFFGILASYAGKVEVIGPVTLTGPFAGSFTNTSYAGQFLTQIDTFTCTTGFAVSSFAQSNYNSTQQWLQATFSGCTGVTGTRFLDTTGSGINAGGRSSTVTITIASPGVVTWTAHGLLANDPVSFATTGSLPTGLVAGTVYYVVGASITTNTFEVSATAGGAAINTSVSQSGTQTATATQAALPGNALGVVSSPGWYN